jgi:hypothetical protein
VVFVLPNLLALAQTAGVQRSMYSEIKKILKQQHAWYGTVTTLRPVQEEHVVAAVAGEDNR